MAKNTYDLLISLRAIGKKSAIVEGHRQKVCDGE